MLGQTVPGETTQHATGGGCVLAKGCGSSQESDRGRGHYLTVLSEKTRMKSLFVLLSLSLSRGLSWSHTGFPHPLLSLPSLLSPSD